METRFPLYQIETRGDGFGASIKSNNRVGYIDVYATSENVYMLYSGIELKNYVKGGSIEFNADNLMIYDWYGNLIDKLKLDIPCRYICASEDNHTIWAIANNPDPVIVKFEI